MTPLHRLFQMPEESEQISPRARRWLRVTMITTIMLPVWFLGVYGMTVFVGSIIWGQAAGPVAVVELGIAFVGSLVCLAFGLWSWHLRVKEKFEAGTTIIASAIVFAIIFGVPLSCFGLLYVATMIFAPA